MSSVSMTELRKQTEQIVERVAAGETIDITRWGKTVATIQPVYPGVERLHQRITMLVERWMNETGLSDEELTFDRSVSGRNE